MTLFLLLALMCENVNAAPQGISDFKGTSGVFRSDLTSVVPVGAAPFTISNPMCQTGFTVAQRYDERNSAGAIIKSVWVRKCVRMPKIIYGGKV